MRTFTTTINFHKMKKITLFLFLLVTQLVSVVNAQICNPPSVIFIDNGYQDVLISWTNNNATNEYDIEYGISGFTPSGIPMIENHHHNTYTTNDLSPHSEYIDFYVRADCGTETSDWIGPFTYYNYCTDNIHIYHDLYYEEDFENGFIPICWTEANQGNPTLGISGFNSSNWSLENFANNASNSMGGKINIQGIQTNDWLLMPMFMSDWIIKGGGTIEISFDIALTEQNSTSASSLGSDDQIQLVISDDLGTSWYHLYTWGSSSSISNTGQSFGILYEYVNGVTANFKEHTFLLAFWASSGAINDAENIDFHIDNIYIDLPFFGGVANKLSAKGFRYFPNPSGNLLNISAKETIDELIFYDVLGRELQNIQINSLRTQLDISNLVEGNYIMKVIIGNIQGSVFLFKQ